MFFQSISKEVDELGKEIMTYYTDIKLREGYSYGNLTQTIYLFRGQEIYRWKKKEDEVYFTGSFSQLNKKERKYLLKCFTKASLKKLTYANNK